MEEKKPWRSVEEHLREDAEARLREAEEILRREDAYNEEKAKAILFGKKGAQALENLKGMRNSTNPAMRLERVNAWYKEWSENSQ